MVEWVVSFNLLPSADMKAVMQWGQKTWDACTTAPGFVEGRTQRGMISSASIRSVSIWKSMSEWASFGSESGPWPALLDELRTYATAITMELWGTSPRFPDPIYPRK